ncbi:protein translocase subunit SecD [Christensenellaceae bacterium OttesenSCG-928-K19]|nr:protein translocase subunit SecD [Christensenellaceae bacterium OttesenSCG-928-K19]
MKTRTRSTVLFVVILVLIALLAYFVINGLEIGIYDVKPLSGIQQGLDITGGVYTVYEAADTSIENFDEEMSNTISVLRNRLDSKGFTEATISRQGFDRIRVEIPINNSSEIQDPTEISQYIGSPAKLEFVGPDDEVIMEGKDIEQAYRDYDENGKPVVAFRLSEEGTKKFAAATTKFVGQNISIRLDGETISSPTVNTEILGGQGIIEGNFTETSSQNLALQIQSGALPIELHEIEVRTISATLGEDALQNSIFAGVVGLVILFAFILIYYRLPGVAACLGLIVYTMCVMLLLGSVPGVQLTLPGIAGIVLGIGMAVDANVIIFERFREEYRTGKTLRTSFRAGSQKAFITILDSNITTLICAVVLAIFGSGQIKSFAYTLIISIIVSMFAALVVSNGIMKLFIGMNPKNQNLFLPKAKEIREKALSDKNGGEPA